MKKIFYFLLGTALGFIGHRSYSVVKKIISYKKIKIVNIPQHIGIIMDGNGRWASRQGKERTYGHKSSIPAIEATIKVCEKYKIRILTLYAFSTENWKRPQSEINEIFSLISDFVDDRKDKLIENKVKLNVLGDMSRIPEDLKNKLNSVMEQTKDFDQFIINICLNYSGRWDITNACNKILQSKTIDKVTTNIFAKNLSTAGIPDPDIIIRTGKEKRISSFLSWECAYSEFFF